MRTVHIVLFTALLILNFLPNVIAQERPDVLKTENSTQNLAKSVLGLYATATEAYEMLKQDPEAILVDVRDPVEIKFTGFADPTKIHVPYELTDVSSWNEKVQSWAMKPNQNFSQEMLTKLNILGAKKDTTIIMICRSGSTRSAPAVDRLVELGYTNVWSVTDGFEGTTQPTGNSKGVRMVDGWRNSGLPWSYRVPADVAWQPRK